jgi:hypothetical protein
MLDGQRYFEEFPDEKPDQPPRLVLSDELLVTLAAIEREISAFIQNTSEVSADRADTSAQGNSRTD